jgi:hypothetical protein
VVLNAIVRIHAPVRSLEGVKGKAVPPLARVSSAGMMIVSALRVRALQMGKHITGMT